MGVSMGVVCCWLRIAFAGVSNVVAVLVAWVGIDGCIMVVCCAGIGLLPIFSFRWNLPPFRAAIPNNSTL